MEPALHDWLSLLCCTLVVQKRMEKVHQIFIRPAHDKTLLKRKLQTFVGSVVNEPKYVADVRHRLFVVPFVVVASFWNEVRQKRFVFKSFCRTAKSRTGNVVFDWNMMRTCPCHLDCVPVIYKFPHRVYFRQDPQLTKNLQCFVLLDIQFPFGQSNSPPV